MAEPPVHFIVPGPIDQRTGGYGYDRRIVAALQALGRTVRVIELDGQFPLSCDIARTSAAEALDCMPDGAVAVIDGLALPAFGPTLSRHARRITVVALVHHPLALETGLSERARSSLRCIERDLFAQTDGIVTTSAATAGLLADFCVASETISVVLPGTDPAPRASGSMGAAVQLLCVGTVIPRKGHALLVDALANCAALDWRLLCLGSLDRDAETVFAVQQRIAAHDLTDRITLAGEADAKTLAAAYAAADIFVLASAFEGYGMAFAEALARGLPVVGSGDGAVRDTVPETAGIIVPVGDRAALAAALTRVIEDPALRGRLAGGAHAAGQMLPDWVLAGHAFAAALDAAV